MDPRLQAPGISTRVVFLDRDGVINRDSPDYIKSWAEFEFLPGSLTAMQRLKRHGFTAIVITNQSIINRRMIPRAQVDDIHTRMRAAVSAGGGHIADVFYCPHRPDENCRCRKPGPGLLYRAREAYGIDLTTAFLVGDSAKDIECARQAGCGRAILVKTGNADAVMAELAAVNIIPDHIAPDLARAVEWIVNRDC